MADCRIKLRIFIAYQLRSKFHSSAHFRSMGKFLKNHSKMVSRSVDLELQYGEFPPGASLWDQIMKKIEAAHIIIADISENNPNVLLEAGIALGLEKHVIFIKCEQSKSNYPSDIHNFVFLPYHSSGTLCEDSFLESIIDSIDYFLRQNHDAYFYHRLLWSMEPSTPTIIVPGCLPDEFTGNRFEDYIHIRTYGDLDAVFTILETMHRLYPRMEISIQSAKSLNDLPRNWQQNNIIFIGGPDFNSVVSEFDNELPIEYKYGPNDNDVWLKHKRTEKEYKPVFYKQQGHELAKDYGFFFAKKQARLDSAKIIFIGGARTWGVYGAALLVSCLGFDKKSLSYANVRRLIENFGSNPSLLIPVEVSGSKRGIHPPIWHIDQVELIED